MLGKEVTATAAALVAAAPMKNPRREGADCSGFEECLGAFFIVGSSLQLLVYRFDYYFKAITAFMTR